MHFFSDDYLMHYGIKGMKWKKKKGPEEFKSPDNYLADAYSSVGRYNEATNLRLGYGKRTKDWHRQAKREASVGSHVYKQHKLIDSRADSFRRADQKKALTEAYKKNQKRIAKQQRKARVKNALKKVKNKVFTDTSGMKKVGSHTYVKFEEPVITSTSGNRGKKRR